MKAMSIICNCYAFASAYHRIFSLTSVLRSCHIGHQRNTDDDRVAESRCLEFRMYSG